MFLGLQLLLLLLISPVIIGVFLYGFKRKEKIIGKFIISIYGLFFSFIFIMTIIGFLNQKMILDKNDYYGEYIINRNYFKGKQTDWQYNHYRFKITKDDSIHLYITEKEKIIKCLKGKIQTLKSYHPSTRLIIEMNEPGHHIFASNPTTYRKPWSFYLVFKSPKFNNMFFIKDEWKPLK